MTHIEEKKRLLNRIEDPVFLYSEFREQVQDLLLAIKQHHMPFIAYETYRTPQRQQKLIDLGFSKIKDPYESTHVHGLAIDFLIDTRVVNLAAKQPLSSLTKGLEKKSRDKKRFETAVYNIGVNTVSMNEKKARTIVEDQLVLNFWNS